MIEGLIGVRPRDILGSTAGAAVILLLPILGCDDSGPTGLDRVTEPLPATFGRVEVDVAFGDPPFEGEVLIIPSTPADEWRYEVDLDEDGASDERGSVGLGVHVGFRYDEPGPHAIHVILDDGTNRYSQERVVMVNDSTVMSMVREQTVGPESIPADFGRPVLSSTGDALFLVDQNRQALFRVDLAPLTMTRQRSLPFDGLLQAGISVAQEDSNVYVLMSSPDVTGRWQVFSRDLMPMAERRETSFAGPFLEPGPSGLLYAWGLSGLTLFDPVSLEVIRELPPNASDDVALSPDGDNLLVSMFEPRGVALLDSNTLRQIWFTPLPDDWDLRPWRVSFSPDGDKVYAILVGNTPGPAVGMGLAVLDARSGEIRRVVGIERGAPSNLSDLVTSFDERFVAFTTEKGMYVIDVGLELPRFRGLGGEFIPIACCQIAASRSANAFYVANSYRSSIVEVRIDS